MSGSSSQLFKAAFEQSSVCKLAYLPDGKLIYMSPAMCRLLGYSPEEISQLTLSDISLPPEPEELEQFLQVLSSPNKGRLQPLEKRFLNRQGEIVWGLQHLTVLWDHRQSPPQLRCLIAEVQDIQSRKRYEAAWAAERQRLSMIEAMVHLGSWQVRFETAQFWLSDECCRILGLDPQALEPGPLMHLSMIHPQDRQAVHERLNEAFKSGQSLILQAGDQPDWINEHGDMMTEFRIVRPDGEIRFVSAKAHPEYSKQGHLRGLSGFILDITSFRLQEKMLQDAQRLLIDQNQQLRELAKQLLSNLQQPMQLSGELMLDKKDSLKPSGPVA